MLHQIKEDLGHVELVWMIAKYYPTNFWALTVRVGACLDGSQLFGQCQLFGHPV
jgi:hypothetical protein